MKIYRKLTAMALALAMALSLAPVPASAANGTATPENAAYRWFYNQLGSKAKAIYDVMEREFEAGTFEDGRKSVDLTIGGTASQADVQAYLDGTGSLFADFAAAKDAFDLEHPEAWYLDSSKLSFRATQEADGTLHAWIGTGREDTYYVDRSLTADKVKAMSDRLERAVSGGVSAASGKSGYEAIREAHDYVTKNISYRYELECGEGNAPYVRTAYGIVTHQGVCESYVRSFQMIMNGLGIPCVPVHGVQASGEPEMHMWCAVKFDGKWYAVDPTWDDPVALDKNGKPDHSGVDGDDGHETVRYLLVGLDAIGRDWHERGVVSDGGFEFKYPVIESYSYGAGSAMDGKLLVEYAHDEMEGHDSTVYKVSFDGDGLAAAAKKGNYLLVKMYDVNADGSVDAFDDWYYVAHGMLALGSDRENFDPVDFTGCGGEYFHDTAEYVVYNIINCEYVEFAVTTKAPPAWQEADDLWKPDMSGYYEGDYSDIIAQSGMMYNIFGGYEQPPYPTNFSPSMNQSVISGREYTIHVEFTDELYRPMTLAEEEAMAIVPEETEDDDEAGMADEIGGEPVALAGVPDVDPGSMTNDKYVAAGQVPHVDFTGETYSWGMLGRMPHEFASKPEVENLRYLCRTHETAHKEGYEFVKGVNTGGLHGKGGAEPCRIYGVEYEFTASKMWADSSVTYMFDLYGFAGVKSNKLPETWHYVFEAQYPFTTCPLCSPFRWNMWGQPFPMANPDGLDLEQIKVKGVDGVEESLAKLVADAHLDPYDMNGRIMMVVENIGNDTPRADQMEQAVAKDLGTGTDAVMSKSIYEIDFSRVCGKTVVASGQAVRMCVGFPEGYGPDDEGVAFKAYHFILDVEEHCDKVNHKDCNHDGHILGVEEINCTVTQYGLVIECMSFSPFMIAAIDAEEAGIEPSDSDSRVLMLNADGHGSLKADGLDGAMIVLKRGESVEISVEAEDGYAVDSVSFSGYGDAAIENGRITIGYADISDGTAMLGVSFVAQAVADAEEEAGQAVVAPEPEVKSEEPDDGDSGNSGDNPGGNTGDNPGNNPGGNTGNTGSTGNTGGSGSGISSPSTSGGVTTVRVSANASTFGTAASVTVGSSSLDRAVSSAVSEAARRGTVPAVEIRVGIASSKASSLDATLPVAGLRTLGITKDASLSIVSDLVSVELDADALQALAGSASGSNVILKFAPVAPSDLNAAQREAVGADANVIDLSVVDGRNGAGGGRITVTLPYAPKSGESADDIVVYYMDDDGSLIACDTVYADGKITFVAAPLGKYVIGNRDDAPAEPEQRDLPARYADVPRDAWYYVAIADMYWRGLMDGMPDGTMAPQGTATRAQIVSVLWRAAGRPATPAGTAYSDVAAGSWYYDAVMWSYGAGVAQGYGGGLFGPGDLVTREQMIAIIYRFARHMDADSVEPVPLEYAIPFSDAGEISSWALDAVAWANHNGLVVGDAGKVLPKSNLTRAEMAAMISGYLAWAESR